MRKKAGATSSEKSQGSKLEHDRLIKAIVAEMSKYGALAWSNPTGAAYRDGRFVAFGLVGSTDIIGIMPDGKFVGIEVKTGQAVRSRSQVQFAEQIIKRGGHYLVARSIDHVLVLFQHKQQN